MKRKSVFGLICGFGLVTIAAIAGLVSCEVGLGEAVDVAAPVISIESPATSAIIRDAFAISGVWSDDGSIKDLTVSLRNTRTNETLPEVKGELIQEPDTKEYKGTWKAVFKPKEDNIPDGNYEATVTISDNGSHKTVITRAFVIDNTPPVVVLQRPSTKASDTDSDVFGQTLSLSGQSADDNNIKIIRVKFFSDPECTNEIHHVDISNVPPTISLDVAKFAEDVDNDYAKIYGSNKKGGKKPPIYCSIIAYDEAKRIPVTDADKKDDDDMGNSTDVYYLYDDIYTDVLSTFKVTQLYSIMNGTYTDEDTSRAAAAKSIPELLKPNEIRLGKLSLNPANNPEFKVVGREGLKKNGTDFTNPANDLSNESNITLKVDVGLDAIPLNKDTLRVYLIPCDATGTLGAEDIPANRIYPNPSDPPYEKNGTGYTFTTKITKEGCKNAAGEQVSLTVGNYYIIAMEGFDSMNNEVVAESDENGHTKTFGFRLAPNGATPQLDVQTSINGKTFDDSAMLYIPRYNPEDESKVTTLKFKGTISVEDGVPTAEYSVDGQTRVPLTVTPTQQEGVFAFETEIDVDDFVFTDEGSNPELKSGQHGIIFYANATQDANPVKKTLMYQVDKPTVKISNVQPLAYNYRYGTNGALVETGIPEKITVNNKEVTKKYINGKNVKLNLTILAGLVGLDESEEKKPKIDFIQNGNIVYTINDAPTFGETDEIDTTDTSIFSPGEVIVRVTAYDMAGYKTVIEESYYIDQATDDPVILPKDSAKSTLSMDYETARSLENKIKNVYYANQTVLYKVIDDDGLDKVTYTITNANNPDVVLKNETVSLSSATDSQIEVTMPETPATYHVVITATDVNTDGSTGISPKTTTANFYARVTASAPNIEEIQLSKTLFSNQDTMQPEVSIKSDQAPFILSRIVKQGQTVNSTFSKVFTHNGSDITYDNDTLEWLGYTKQQLGLQDSDTVIATETISSLNGESPAITDSIPLSSISSSGSYTIEYRVIDVNYKYKEATKSFTVDVTPPQIDQIKLDNAVYAADTWYKSKTLALNVKASDAEDAPGMSTVEYSTDNTTWTSLSYDSALGEYKGSSVFETEGAQNKLYVRVTDRAGNTTTLANPGYYTVKIDASVPELGVTDNTNKYVQSGSSLTVQGNYEDPQSGVDKLSFKIDNRDITNNVTVKYSTDNSTFKTYDQITDKSTIKYWKVEFIPTDTGKFIVTGKNIAGDSTSELKAFDITIDSTAPVISNVKLEETKSGATTATEAYKDDFGVYYINNSTAAGKSFKISGISTDDTGIKSVTIQISALTVQPTMDGSTGKWSFNLTSNTSSIIDKTGNTTAIVTVEDNAGRTSTEELTIKFDTTSPQAKHWADAKNKDIYFRIGNADNDKDKSDSSKWETGDEVGDGTTEDDNANIKVGSKYSFGSYGKDSSMEVRGTFEETDSGLKTVYYKLYTDEPDPTASDFLDNFEPDGNISIVNEIKHVPYNIQDGTDAQGKPKYKKSYEPVISNFHGQIQVFDNTQTNKYLVLVAEDNAGNRAADTLEIHGGPASPTPDANWNAPKNGTLKNYYSLNKDTTPPTITGSITEGAYTNGTGNVTVGGTVSDGDAASGVKSVTVRIDEGTEQTANIDDDGNWTKSIAASTFTTGSYTVYATAIDNAGDGNSKQISLGTITVDTEDPDFSNIKVTETVSSTTKDVYSTTASNVTSYYVKNNASGKTFKISGLATDNFGVESVKLDVVANSTTKLATQEKTGEAIKGTCEFTIGDWSGWEVASATATITVTDKAGNEITKDLNIVFDRGSPTVDKTKLTLPTKAQTESSLFTFKGDAGSVADSISAPEKIDIAFTSNTTAPTAAQVSGIEVSSSGTTKGSWSTTVDFTQNSVFDSEGTKYLWILPYDKTGNAGSWTSSNAFTYDKATPIINFEDTSTVTNPAVNSYNKSGFTLQVKATDSYGVQKVEIYNGDTKLADATAGSNGIYSKAFTVGTGTGALADGTYNFTVKVTDKAGKTNSVSRSLYVDATKPVISEFAVQDTLTPFTDSSSHKWYNRTQIPLTVTVTDALSGMASVQAYVDSDSSNPASLIKGTGTSTTWTGNIVCNTEGSHTIHIVATDVAGNQNIDKSIPVYIDTTAPAAPVFLGAGPSGSIAPANDITSLLVNPTLGQDVIVYAALKDEGNTANSTGIAATAAFKQKGKSGTSATAAATTITAFTPDWAASHEYAEGNIIKNSNILYMCKTAHTSDTSFDTTNWTSLSDYAIWSYTIPTSDMTSGGINFTVKDKAGNEADYVLFQMTVDKKAPVVTPEALVDADTETTGTQINGKISISGTASDKNGLSTTETMKLYYTTSSSLGTATTAPASTDFGTTPASKWKQIKEITAGNTWSFDNIDTSKLDGSTAITNETTVYFLISAKDKAGNIGYSARDAKIKAIVDQDSDRPVIKFTNLKFGTSAMSASNLVPHQQTDLYGSITDDDGIKNVHYIMSADSDPAADAAGWQSLTIENGSFTLNFDDADGNTGDGDGTKKLYFKIVDTAENTFISSKTDNLNLKTPKLKDNSATAVKYGYRSSDTGYKQTVAYLKVDNHAPFEGALQFTTKSGSTDNPTAADWKSKSEISSMPFGGPGERKTFKIRVPAWDANVVQSVTMTLPGKDSITFTNTNTAAGVTAYPNATWWISPEIDVSALSTANKTCTITVSDGVKTSSDEFVIAIDNTAPTISATNPSSSQYSSGNVIAYGETDLTYWKNTSTTDQPKEFMYYALSLDNTTIPAVDFESQSSATAITKWKDENGTEITDTNKPAGANVTLSYKPYYTSIKGGSFNWYVYFDDGASTENDSHDVSFKQFLINSGVTTQEAIETTDQDNKFRTKVQAYLWIKAVDQVGNETILKHPVLIDPQGDAPTVTIGYPEEDGTTLGGSVTLRGTANDEKGSNPGVDSVWVQIISAKHNGYTSSNTSQTIGADGTATASSGLKFTDTVTDGNHTYAVTDFKPTMKDVKQWITATAGGNKIYNVYTNITNATPTAVNTVGTGDGWEDTDDGSKYYIKARFSGSAWNLDINKNKEFDPAAGKLNPVVYRIFAKDKDNNLSSYEQQLSVFDCDNPILSGLYLRQYATNATGEGAITASRPYEDDMWINGTWWLCGTATDTDGLSALKVNNVNQTISGSTGTIKYKLAPSSESIEVDSFEIEIEASDIANQGQSPHTTRKTCVINYDKKKPELATTSSSDFNISQSIQNSNGFYTFGSQVTENQEGGKAQSGFDYLAFWFEREITGTGGKHVVFDVMRPKSTATETYASEVAWSNLATFTTASDAKGLKWKKITTTRTSADLGKLTINTEDKNIHVGGLCMISGSVYFITSVEKNAQNKWEIGINGQPEYTTATQDVYFAIANVVNNNVESARGAKLKTDGAYGYYATVDNDDGDHMLESVKKQGTAWTWEANINSQNMADGDITIHYVAFDKAGNFSSGTVPAQVANNAPRLASLTVWSDFNANNDQDDGEYETMYYLAKERKLSEGYVQRATSLNPTNQPFVVSGNNKDYDDGGSAFMTVKDKTRFIPEIVGGNGNLYYSYKYGKSNAIATATAKPGENIGVGADHGIDEDIDSEGYYKEDQNGSGYIQGRTNLYEGTTVTAANQKFMEIPGELENETTNTYSLNKLGNSTATDPMWFEYTIYDSTIGCDDWSTSTLTTTGRLSSTFRVALAIKYQDNTAPVVKIRPFYWNSSTEGQNSISWDADGNPEGHIELEGDLTDKIKGNGEGQLGMGDDPKVSGKIIVEGYAYDDIKLKELYVQMSNHTNLKGSGTTGVKVASYNGSWITTTHDADAGWDFTASDVYCNGNGHLVYWKLTVDTAKRTTVAETNQTVVVYAVDARGSDATKTSIHNGTTQTTLPTYIWGNVRSQTNALKTYYTDFYCNTSVTASTPDSTIVYKASDLETSMTYYYQMDIVPYITKVTTGLSSLKNAKQDSIYSRTSLGHYPVSVKNTGANGAEALTNTITISGFNLGTTTTVSLASISTEAATKGYYDHIVSDIPALNNYNKNDASGTSCVTLSNADVDYEKINKYGYNRIPNNSNNNKLTDDVIFDVWRINSDAARTYEGNTALREPVVRVNPTNGVVGMAFGNGSSRFSMPNKAGTNNGTSYELWQYNYATYVNIALCYDENGVAHGISTGIDTYVANDSQKAGRMSYFKSAWGPSRINNVNGNFEGGNAIRFDCIGIPRRTTTDFGVTTGSDPLLEEYRFYSPSIVATQKGDDGNNRTNPTVYYAYYDKLSQQIRFRAGDIGDTVGTNGQFYQASANGEPAFIDNHYSVISGTSKYSNKDNMYNGGKYLGIDVIPGTSHDNDVVVAVWQDAITDALIFAYNDAPYAKVNKQWNADEEASGWKGYTSVKANAGFYCKVKCDSNGNVHIASVNDQDEVCYTYIPYTAGTKTFGTPVTVTIDTFESGVKKVAIDVDKNNLPYITYFGTKGQPKMAYLPSMPATKSETTLKGCDTNGFTGVWEVGFIPTNSKLADDDARNQTSVWAPKDLTGTAAETNFYGAGEQNKAAGITLSNTTSPLVGYGVSPDGTSGRIELAQKW